MTYFVSCLVIDHWWRHDLLQLRLDVVYLDIHLLYVCGCGRGWLVYKCVCGCGQGRLVYKSLAADVNSMLVVIDTDSLQPVDHVALAHGERNLNVAVVNHGTE